jgi:hypothetical protein
MWCFNFITSIFELEGCLFYKLLLYNDFLNIVICKTPLLILLLMQFKGKELCFILSFECWSLIWETFKTSEDEYCKVRPKLRSKF